MNAFYQRIWNFAKRRKKWLVLFFLLIFLYLNNSSLLAEPPGGKPILLAHRGLGHTFAIEGITDETCTADRIHPPEHPYLENTIPSMRAAFEYGADIVELDIHPTKDGQFAVFHDWTLDCRTDGSGVTREKTMEELKKLDIGYGYTADGGKTYPFRGKGVGMMPTLDEVLSTFPDRSLLIHIKSDDPREGVMLAERLSKLPPERLERLAVYGGDRPIAELEKHLPAVRTMSKASLKRCLLQYEAIGWTGIIPDACKGTQLHIPVEYASWLWGWPHRFLSRMEQVGTRVILVKYIDGFSRGFDTPEDLEDLPKDYSGGIWTNRIDRIAPLVNQQ